MTGVKRHILKTITWRLVGTIDTIILSWIVSGDLSTGITIGSFEVITKMILYYVHERIWFRTRVFQEKSSKIRHLLKTITWRLVGTVDTMFMGWLVTGDPTLGLQIGGLELITKMGLYYLHERAWHLSKFDLDQKPQKAESAPSSKAKNITNQHYSLKRIDRNQFQGHNSLFILFTGLSGSGKSTIANELEVLLSSKGVSTYTLDGDNVRFGLNKDLGFSKEERNENLRRIGEVGKLFVDSGKVTLAAFIAPLNEDRAMIKNIIGSEDYIEVFVNTSLEECEKRDIKGLYKKARAGEIKDFTGVSSPFEIPTEPHIILNTIGKSSQESAIEVYNLISNKLNLKNTDEQILSELS